MVDQRHSLEITKVKIFGGHEYILHDAYKTKASAEEQVKRFRDNVPPRWRARLVKSRSLAYPYAVYYRPIHGWTRLTRKVR